MKKLITIAAMAMLVGATVSSAQEADRVLVGPVKITFKGKLSNGNPVTEATLATAAGGGTLQFATVQFIDTDVFTGGVFSVIGTGIGTTNTVSGGVTNTSLVGKSLLTSDDAVNLSKAGSKSAKFISAWSQDAFDFFSDTNINVNSTISNAVLLVQGTVSASKGTNLNAKVEGIWVAGDTAVKGSIKTAK